MNSNTLIAFLLFCILSVIIYFNLTEDDDDDEPQQVIVPVYGPRPWWGPRRRFWRRRWMTRPRRGRA